MNSFFEFMGWISGPAGLAALGALWAFYLKMKSDAETRRESSCKEHDDHGDQLDDHGQKLDDHGEELRAIKSSIDTFIEWDAALKRENQTLREELAIEKAKNAASERRIAKFEKDLSNALALGSAVKKAK